MCHGCVAIQVRVPVCAGVGAEPVQGEEAAGSDDSVFVRKYRFSRRPAGSQYNKLGPCAFGSQTIKLIVSMS